MAKGKKKTAERKVGRPKRKFTEAQVRRMGELAFAGCQNNTIATIMDIPKETLVVNFGHLLTKKRCERKLKLRREQNKATKAGVPSMLIWMGKQTLEQVDKAELSGPGGGPLQITMVDYGKIDDSKPTV